MAVDLFFCTHLQRTCVASTFTAYGNLMFNFVPSIMHCIITQQLFFKYVLML